MNEREKATPTKKTGSRSQPTAEHFRLWWAEREELPENAFDRTRDGWLVREVIGDVLGIERLLIVTNPYARGSVEILLDPTSSAGPWFGRWYEASKKQQEPRLVVARSTVRCVALDAKNIAHARLNDDGNVAIDVAVSGGWYLDAAPRGFDWSPKVVKRGPLPPTPAKLARRAGKKAGANWLREMLGLASTDADATDGSGRVPPSRP